MGEIYDEEVHLPPRFVPNVAAEPPFLTFTFRMTKHLKRRGARLLSMMMELTPYRSGSFQKILTVIIVTCILYACISLFMPYCNNFVLIAALN